MENKLWFRRKFYGFGWYPASWQGWLVTLLYIVIVLFLSYRVDEGTPFNEQLVPFILPLFVVTLLFVLIAGRKGEKPRWQWGGKEVGNENTTETSIKEEPAAKAETPHETKKEEVINKPQTTETKDDTKK